MKRIRVVLFIGILSLLLLSLNFSCTNNYKEYKEKPVRIIGDDIINKIEKGEYDRVDSYINYLIDKKPFSMDGTRVLEDVYSYVAEKAKYKGLSFDNWCSLNPQQHSAFIFRGTYYISEAWKARGAGFAYTVSDEGWKSFEDYLVLAEHDLKKAYSIKPNDAYAPSMMITVCMGLKRSEEEMEEWFQRAIKADPFLFNAYVRKFSFLAPKWRGTMEKYAEFSEYCYRNEPGKGIIYEVMLDFIMENSTRARNIKEYYETPETKNLINQINSKTLERFPKSISIRKKISKIQYDLRNIDEVMRIYNDALSVDPLNPVMLLYRGIVYQDNLKKPKLAEDDFRKSIELDPYNPSTLFRIARIYAYEHRDYIKADEYYTKAINLVPKDKTYYLWRAVNKTFMQKYPEALEDFNMSEKLDEFYIHAKVEKARCLEKLGRIDEAVEYYHNTLKLIESEKAKGDAGSISPKDVEVLTRTINWSLDVINGKQ